MRGDEKTREYRDRVKAVLEYTSQHGIPKVLCDSMQEHVELYFRSQEHSDERVLASLPSTIRRRTLRCLLASREGGGLWPAASSLAD